MATCNMSPTVLAQAVKAYSYVILWMSISISVILFNKWLLAYAGFPFPISLTLWHMFFCSTVAFLCVRVFKVGSSRGGSPLFCFKALFVLTLCFCLLSRSFRRTT